MPDLIHTRFSIVVTSWGKHVVGNSTALDRHQRELYVAGIHSALNLDDALADSKAIEEYFVPVLQEERPFGGENVIFVLQAEVNLRVTVAQNVNRQEGRMLRDTHEAFAETAYFAEDVLQAIGGLLLDETLWEEVVDFFEKSDVPQGVGLSLTKSVEVNPAQHNVGEEDAQGLGQLLVELDDHGPF